MPDNSASKNESVANAHRTGGMPEETSFTVKKVDGQWVVENNVGESVGQTADRAAAIILARRSATEQKASGISVLGEDGSVEETIDV